MDNVSLRTSRVFLNKIHRHFVAFLREWSYFVLFAIYELADAGSPSAAKPFPTYPIARETSHSLAIQANLWNNLHAALAQYPNPSVACLPVCIGLDDPQYGPS